MSECCRVCLSAFQLTQPGDEVWLTMSEKSKLVLVFVRGVSKKLLGMSRFKWPPLITVRE